MPESALQKLTGQRVDKETMELNPNQWYALRVRARFEKQASELLHFKGYETFLPTYVSRRRWTDRIRQVETALFPGYVFCRMGEMNLGLALTTPGVMHFVGFGSTPAPVDDAEIEAVRRVVESGVAGQPCPYLKVGESVEITSGPLTGLSGFLLEIKGDRSLVVGVSLLQRSMAVEIDPSWLISTSRGRKGGADRRVGVVVPKTA
ncbi:MAG: UpxY family transcription antiterminator [Bryobacterales bacterium]